MNPYSTNAIVTTSELEKNINVIDFEIWIEESDQNGARVPGLGHQDWIPEGLKGQDQEGYIVLQVHHRKNSISLIT